MKTLTLAMMLMSLPLAAQDSIPAPSSKAFVKQFIVAADGSTMTLAPIVLDTKTGSFNTLPLDGIAALFELWVYPLLGEDGSEAVVGDAQLMDSEVVGIIPQVAIEFNGQESFTTPRTRADWDHQITVTISDPVGESSDGEIETQEWLRHMLVRKRFLAEDLVGQANDLDAWQEVDSYPITHVTDNQVEVFADSAFPPGVTNSEKWSGIIEYEVVLADWPDSPIPLLSLQTMQVRVWPRWDVTFANIPTEMVSSLPSDMGVTINDIYPGADKVVIEYLYKSTSTENFDDASAVTLYTENWTAIAPQQRMQTLSGMAGLNVPGDYEIRVAMHYPWGVEYSTDLTMADMEDTLTPPPIIIPVGSSSILFRGGVHSLE